MEKNIISEINRVKELMGLEVLLEQTVAPKELVEMYMTNDLNKIILSKQDELAGNYFIAIVGDSNRVELRYGKNGSKGADFDKAGGRWRLPIPRWSIEVPTDDIDLIAELENSEPHGKSYRAFFKVNDDLTNFVKKEINRVKVKFLFYVNRQASSDGFGGFTFYQLPGKKKPKGVPIVDLGQSFPITEITPLGSKSGSRSNVVGLKLGKRMYGEVYGSGLQAKLQRLQLNIPAKLLPPQPDSDPIIPDIVIAPEPFVINTKQNYLYDKPGLTPEAKKAIDTQIFEELFAQGGTRMKEYIDFLKDKTIVVSAFSSRDGDPDAIQNGAYKQCQVKGSKRSEYNQCLSEKRAQNVVEYLKTASNGILSDINFKSVGMGENCKSGNCWKPGKKNHSSKETQFDRRFSVNFPKWDGTTN